MIALVTTGIKLVIAKGDEKEMKKATTVFIGTAVGVFIALFAYLLVKVIANAF
jgi:hypothetical protein